MAVDEAMHGRSYVTPLVAKGLMEALANESPTRKHLASPRQREVLQLLAEGRTMKQIAGFSKSSRAPSRFTSMA